MSEDAAIVNPKLTRFRQACFRAAEGLLLAWMAASGIAAALILPAHRVYQWVSLSILSVGGLATLLVILSGYLAPAYVLGKRPEISGARVRMMMAFLLLIWGQELAKDFSATLFNATHARVELVPEAVQKVSDAEHGPSVVIYGSLSQRTPQMLQKVLDDYQQSHPGLAPIETVYLNSVGGDTKSILEIIKVVESAKIQRTVAFGSCVSACATLWLLMPNPLLAQNSTLCFHGSHSTFNSKAVHEVDDALRAAILARVPADASTQVRAAQFLDDLLSHGLWELSCLQPQALIDAGLLPAHPKTNNASGVRQVLNGLAEVFHSEVQSPSYPEGVGRFITANPPGCLAKIRIPKLPPLARDPKEDGCSFH